jgi:hypothetical protein
MKIFILPVSGGGFVVQLAIIQHLSELNIIPDLTMSSSGGNVAAYISAAADWKWNKIEMISREMNNNLFAKPWSNIALISFLTGFFQGNLYNKGSGVEDFLKKYFTPEKIVKHEIWTGTYNKDTQKAQLFCNRSKCDSIMAKFKMDHNLTQSMDNIYADGNIDLLAKVSLASASIPGIVPPQIINGKPYTDGGNFGASPLTIMKGSLIQYITKTKKNKNGAISNSEDGENCAIYNGENGENGKKIDCEKCIHLFYINSVDLSDIEKFDSFNVLDIWKQATEDLIRSFCVFDRLAAYEILRSQSNDIKSHNFKCTYNNLKKIKKISKLAKYTLLELYPQDPLEVNITSFTGDDTINAIRKAYNNCLCRFWWVSNDNDEKITNIFESDFENNNHDVVMI